MATTASGGHPVGWPSRLAKARLHFVTGKGGTGKSTVAAALALTLAAGGRRVLLVEVEGRQGIAQLFDVPPLPYKEQKIATADGGGLVNALAIDTEAAFLEYLDMFYNLGIAGRAMRRIGAIEFATTIAPGLRDVLLTGKIKESVVRVGNDKHPVYDAVVVDSPPTGRIARFIVNRNIPTFLQPDDLAKAADGVLDADAIRADLTKTGITLADNDFAGLLTETIEHATRIRARAESAEALDAIDVSRLELPAINDGIDLGSLYELAEALAQQGVR